MAPLSARPANRWHLVSRGVTGRATARLRGCSSRRSTSGNSGNCSRACCGDHRSARHGAGCSRAFRHPARSHPGHRLRLRGMPATSVLARAAPQIVARITETASRVRLRRWAGARAPEQPDRSNLQHPTHRSEIALTRAADNRCRGSAHPVTASIMNVSGWSVSGQQVPRQDTPHHLRPT